MKKFRQNKIECILKFASRGVPHAFKLTTGTLRF